MAIDFTLEDHVATITINRPERMNAMDTEHYDALSAAWVRVRDDPEIRVAIVTGAGEKSFSAGADLKSFVGAQPPLSELLLTQKNQILNRGLEVWKPIVAAVNGYCLGGGMTLLLATDLRIAAEHATFSVRGGEARRVSGQRRHAAHRAAAAARDRDGAAAARRQHRRADGTALGPRQSRGQGRPSSWRRRAISRRASPAMPRSPSRPRRSSPSAAATSTCARGLRMEELFLRLLQDSEDVREGTTAFGEKRAPSFRGR